MAAVPSNPTPQQVDAAIRHWDIQVRAALANGTIVKFFTEHRHTVRDIWEHKHSDDRTIAAVFLRKTFLGRFIKSWKNNADPTFVVDQRNEMQRFDKERADERKERKARKDGGAAFGAAADVRDPVVHAAPPVAGPSSKQAVGDKAARKEKEQSKETAAEKEKRKGSKRQAEKMPAAESSASPPQFIGPGPSESDKEEVGGAKKFKEIDGSSDDEDQPRPPAQAKGKEKVAEGDKGKGVAKGKAKSRAPEARGATDADDEPQPAAPVKKQYKRPPAVPSGVFFEGEEACTRCSMNTKLRCEMDAKVGAEGSCLPCRAVRQKCSRVIPLADRKKPEKKVRVRVKAQAKAKSRPVLSETESSGGESPAKARTAKVAQAKRPAAENAPSPAAGQPGPRTPPPKKTRLPRTPEKHFEGIYEPSAEGSSTSPSERVRRRAGPPQPPSDDLATPPAQRWASPPLPLQTPPRLPTPPDQSSAGTGIRPPHNAAFASVYSERQDLGVHLDGMMSVMEARLERLTRVSAGCLDYLEGFQERTDRCLGYLEAMNKRTLAVLAGNAEVMGCTLTRLVRLERALERVLGEQLVEGEETTGEDTGREEVTGTTAGAEETPTGPGEQITPAAAQVAADSAAPSMELPLPPLSMDERTEGDAAQIPPSKVAVPSEATTTIEIEPPTLPNPAVNVVTATPQHSQDALGGTTIALHPSSPVAPPSVQSAVDPTPHPPPTPASPISAAAGHLAAPGRLTRSRSRSHSASPMPGQSTPNVALPPGPSTPAASPLSTPRKRKPDDEPAGDSSHKDKKRR